MFTLLAPATRTATDDGEGNEAGDAFSRELHRFGRSLTGLVCILDVTDAATETGDELDVFIQTRIDGANWLDVLHFTKVLGDGGAVRHIGKILFGAAETMFLSSAALAAGVSRGLAGDDWRVRWDVVDATTEGNVSFDFGVTAVPMG